LEQRLAVDRDPGSVARKEFGGTQEELAVVSGYINALSKLRKKVKESSQSHALDGEVEEGNSKK
jgi:hypothetical protein